MGLRRLLLAASDGNMATHARNYRHHLERRIVGSRAWHRATAPVLEGLGRRPTLSFLETHLVDHCNLNCRGCSHFSPASAPRYADPSRMERDFERLAQLFGRVDVLRLMGGEPLLHPDVEHFLIAARSRLADSEISLGTNGLLLAAQPPSFWRTLARERIDVRVTRYPVAPDTRHIRALCESFGVRWWMTPLVEQFLMVPVVPSGDRDATEMRRRCRRRGYYPFLHEGAVYPCAKVAMAPILEARFGVALPRTDADRIVLDDASSGFDVLRFLSEAVPWCRHCGYDEACYREWSRGRPSGRDWIQD